MSKSGYYKWLLKKDLTPKDYPDFLTIEKIFNAGKKKLGWRAVKMKLENQYKVVMNHKKIRRIMVKYSLTCLVRRRNPYKAMQKATKEHRTFDNLLNRQFKQTAPGRALCTDITYLYYGKGRKAYLSVIKDIATGETLSWEVSQNIELEFVLKTVAKLQGMHLPKDALIHSDQGAHYTSPIYSKHVKELGLTQSMSRKGNCIDNSPMESFFGHFKDELDFRECQTFQQLTDRVNQYMYYYNNHRYQWSLNKMTPVEYRSHLLAASAA